MICISKTQAGEVYCVSDHRGASFIMYSGKPNRGDMKNVKEALNMWEMEQRDLNGKENYTG